MTQGSTPDAAAQMQEHRLVLVTGPSGAGRSTTINALEDLGYETIDNLPLTLVPRLVDGPSLGRPLALGIDVRNRDFTTDALASMIDRLTRDPRVELELLYLDCAIDVLLRRYSETRRRHPLAPQDTPLVGLEHERELLSAVRDRADHLIDTSDLNPHELKAEIARLFDLGKTPRLALSVQSFSYKRGVPRGLDMMFDCRFLANPHWQPALKSLDGRDQAVADYVMSDTRAAEFHLRVTELLLFLLPEHLAEGKAYFAIGFGCTGGQHRSVAVAEWVGKTLADAGWPVSKRHRELERRAASGGQDTGVIGKNGL